MKKYLKKITFKKPPSHSILELSSYFEQKCGLPIKINKEIKSTKSLNRFADECSIHEFIVAPVSNQFISNEKLAKTALVYTKSNNFLAISGKHALPSRQAGKVKTLAIVTLYNDRDIITQVVEHLASQGVSTHIIDNWSNDGSFELVVDLAKKYSTLSYERFPDSPPQYYEWTKLLKRVEAVAITKKFDWYIHYDADEIRISPWEGVSLAEAISFIDSVGYNALDFTILDFRPTKDGFSGHEKLEQHFRHFEFGSRPGHFVQTKAWKGNGKRVDLHSSGGHEAVFFGRKTYPLKFTTKHYPLRSSKQAKRKIFGDRLPRISPEEKKKGWHSQYNNFQSGSEFLWSKEDLIDYYQPGFRQEYLLELLFGIGIKRQ